MRPFIASVEVYLRNVALELVLAQVQHLQNLPKNPHNRTLEQVARNVEACEGFELRKVRVPAMNLVPCKAQGLELGKCSTKAVRERPAEAVRREIDRNKRLATENPGWNALLEPVSVELEDLQAVKRAHGIRNSTREAIIGDVKAFQESKIANVYVVKKQN